MTGHSVAGGNRIALTRSIRREMASENGGVAPGGRCVADAPVFGCRPDADAVGSAARFAPQFPQNAAPSAIVVPHFGQVMARAPWSDHLLGPKTFCAES